MTIFIMRQSTFDFGERFKNKKQFCISIAFYSNWCFLICWQYSWKTLHIQECFWGWWCWAAWSCCAFWSGPSQTRRNRKSISESSTGFQPNGSKLRNNDKRLTSERDLDKDETTNQTNTNSTLKLKFSCFVIAWKFSPHFPIFWISTNKMSSISYDF